MSNRPDRADILELVNAALLAPSGDNCQPWRFRWDGRCLEIAFVPERAASLYDVRNSASWVALGTSLTNLRVASRERGLGMEVELFPADGAPHVVARLRFSPSEGGGDLLFPTLAARCVNRRAYRQGALPGDVRTALAAAAHATPAVHLDLVEDQRAIAAWAALAARNEQLLFENRHLHDEWYRWLRWTPEAVASSRDGLPVASLELNLLQRWAMRAMGAWSVVRLLAVLGVTRLLPLQTRQCYRRSAALALFSVDDDRPEAFVRAGEAIERLWLTATLHHLACQPLTGMLLFFLRRRLLGGEGLSPRHRDLIDQAARAAERLMPSLAHHIPVMLLRLGYASPPTTRALRLPIEAVLTFQE